MTNVSSSNCPPPPLLCAGAAATPNIHRQSFVAATPEIMNDLHLNQEQMGYVASAFLLAYGDCFLILGCVLLSSATALFFMKKAKISGATGGH